VILAPKDYERWMAPADPARLLVDLLRPYDAHRNEGMEGERCSGERAERFAGPVNGIPERLGSLAIEFACCDLGFRFSLRPGTRLNTRWSGVPSAATISREINRDADLRDPLWYPMSSIL